MTSALALSDLRSIGDGLDHPEGVAMGPDGMLYAGGEAGQVYRVDPVDGSTEQIADTGGFALGVCLDGAGAVYVCDMGRQAVLRVDPASGEVEPWCEAAAGEPLITPNWGAFAPDGSLVFSDSGTDESRWDGRILRVPPGGGDAELLDLPPLQFPNGLAIDAAGTVFFLESFTPRLQAIRDGGLELVSELPGVVPDGVALDRDGGFVIGCYYPFRVLRVAPDGSRTEVLLDDTQGTAIPMPTNVCFFGEDLGSMAIAQLGGYSLGAITAAIPGAPLHYPAAA
jgi:sugar lactone lactonase YvrE